ncbi:alpha/beta hydrolase [Roseibium sp.]|uniref:alpha/beta hydrolase n=1 Tax=Roseibium sp. TaxID=1936156 RepID=UPI003BB1B0A2
MNWIATSLAGVTGLVLLALVLVVTVTLWPRENPFRAQGLTAKEQRAIELKNGVVFDQTYPFRDTHFVTGDGARIAARLFGSDTAANVIVLVHGIGAAGDRWNNPAGLLATTAKIQVVAVDLRGHNNSSGARYDVDHFGQYEDDLAEVITFLRTARPDARIWLAGHSMGGGIALRYALKQDRPRLSGYLLFAPYFGPGPTEPKTPLPDSPLHIDRLRITGLIAFNAMGLEAFNHLHVAHLNMPPEYPSYTFRAIASGLPMPPQTAEDGLAAMEGNVIIVAGDEDAAVNTAGYAEVAAPFSHVEVRIVPGHGHDSFLNDRKTHDLVAAFVKVSPNAGDRPPHEAQATHGPEKEALAGN